MHGVHDEKVEAPLYPAFGKDRRGPSTPGLLRYAKHCAQDDKTNVRVSICFLCGCSGRMNQAGAFGPGLLESSP
jgi:hypothetical protein